jgi:CHAD domain-containing protein
MAYALERNEPISAAIPRIVTERIDLAIEQLLDEKETPGERIHNARKRFKESRAALRLIRFSLGDHFEIENAWFRDAGRRLAALRDADAVLESAGLLADYAEGYHERRLVRRLRRRLGALQRRARRTDLVRLIEETARELPGARARVGLWPQLPDDFSAIGPGFRRTYRDGRSAFREAEKSPSPQSFHEWRKRVKDHWYQLQILRDIAPVFTKPYRAEIETLSDALGDRHDLDVLRQTVVELADFGNRFELERMHAMIDRRTSELSETAVEIGARIYADTPKVVLNRFESHWVIWSAAASR